MKLINKFLGLLALANCNILLAATAGKPLPWDRTLDSITASITGPIGTAVSIIALATCGAVMIFKSEITDTVQLLLRVAMGVSVITGSAGFVQLFTNPGVIF